MRPPFALLFALEHILWQSIAMRIGQVRNRLYPKLPRGLLFNGKPLIANTEQEAADLFATARLPVLWKGGAASTPLMRWTPEYLKVAAGDVRVKILKLPGLGDGGTDQAEQIMPLSKFIDNLSRAKAYLRFSDLLERSEILRADLPHGILQRLSGGKRRINLQFFLGAKGGRTPLHAEMNCNIFIQVFGKKRWLVLPASATSELLVPAARRFYFFSGIDAFAHRPDARRDNPLQGVEMILEPGDILLCPPLVWHAVENTMLSCSVGYKFNNYLWAFKASPLLFAMNALARNPSYVTYLWHLLVRKKHPILASE